MTENSHRTNPAFPTILRNVYTHLQEQARLQRPAGEVLIQQDDLHFLSMWTGLKDNFDWRRFRRSIGTILGLAEFRMVQVVGDSGSELSPTGVERAQRVIRSLVDAETLTGRETVIEYGYTATTYDTNWVVNEIIATTPQLANRVVANLVYMSATAVESWGCEALEAISKFVLVYDEKETVFGDDVWLSDYVMSAEYSDKLIVLEGGPQTFLQSVNACLREVSVIILTGPGMRAQLTGTAKQRFSAARLLALLHDELQRCADQQNPTAHELQKMKNLAVQYLDTFEEIENNHSKYVSIVSALDSLLLEAAKLQVIEIEHVE